MGRLTVAKLRSLSKPGRYGDGGTLFLNVARGGSKSWIQRLTVAGKRRDIGLGGWPVVKLAEARDQAFENRRIAQRGGDPVADRRRASKAPTFREAAERTFEANRVRWRSNKTASNWLQGMAKRVLPVIGDMRVDRIGREDVLRILTPIWTSRPEIARKLRSRIRAVLAWAQAHGHIEHNLAGEAIDGALPAMPAVKAHFRALPYQETLAALLAIDGSEASTSVKACLGFVALTACRSGEARGATWAEIDFEAREWRIPASRMKGGLEHRVPLSAQALAMLEIVEDLRDGSDWVFPSPRLPGKPLSNMALAKCLKSCGLADRATVHGFRTSFRTWASEKTDADHAVMELCLAHRVGPAVERAYARSELFEKRRELMDQWGHFLSDERARVGARVGERDGPAERQPM